MSATVPIPVQVPPPQPAAPVATPPPTPKQRSPWLWALVALTLAACVWWAYRAMTRPTATPVPAIAVRTGKVVNGTLERTLRLGGQTSARDFANITAPLMRGPEMRGDMILIKLATSGSLVKKGDIVAQIDAQSIQDHIDDLNDTIEAAQADVNKRQAEQAIEWENLQQTLRVSKAEYDKARLDARGAEVKTDIEKQLLQLSLDEAEAAYKQQLADLKFKKAAHEAELRILRITVERHVRHRDRHGVDLKRFTMTAPMSGLVVMSPIFRNGDIAQFQLGDRVYPGQGFMKIVDPKSMQVEATMNQSESSSVRIGQEARIYLDAFPGMEFMGRVYSVGALAVSGWRQNYYIRTVPVRVAISGFDPKLIPDLSASADIILDRAENQLIVRRSAIHAEKDGTYAYVKVGETFEKRKVQLGLMNETQAVVTAGLAAGDEVKLN